MAKARSKRGLSKQAFVLSQPFDMPAKEVINKARQTGMHIKQHYVYIVRSLAKRQKSGTAGRVAKSASTPEAEFRRLAIELGLAKSKELLQETEQKITDLIRGK